MLAATAVSGDTHEGFSKITSHKSKAQFHCRLPRNQRPSPSPNYCTCHETCTSNASDVLHLPRKVDLKPQKHEDSLALATKSVKHQVQTRAHMCAPQQERRLETAGLSCEACVWENHLQIHQASHLQFDELVPSHRSMWKATTGRSQTQSHHGI